MLEHAKTQTEHDPPYPPAFQGTYMVSVLVFSPGGMKVCSTGRKSWVSGVKLGVEPRRGDRVLELSCAAPDGALTSYANQFPGLTALGYLQSPFPGL